MLQYYFAIIVFAVLTMVILIVLAARNDALSTTMKRAIVVSAAMIATAACCEFLGVAMDGAARIWLIPHMVVKACELSLAPSIPVLVANAIRPVKRPLLLLIPLLLHGLLQFSSIWSGLTFYMNADNVYLHGPLYGIYYVMYFLGMAFVIMQVSRSMRDYQVQNKLSMFLIMVFLLLGILWQVIDSSMKVVWLAIAIVDVLFYAFFCDMLQQTDVLTRLLNRRSYDTRIRALHQQGIILYADIDHFKSVNDNFGHAFGDICLSEVADALKMAYGKHGFCYRIGGDEFCVLLSANAERVEACNADFFHRLEEKRSRIPNLPHVAIGYANYDPDSMSAMDAAAKADQMMYAYKHKKELVSE